MFMEYLQTKILCIEISFMWLFSFIWAICLRRLNNVAKTFEGWFVYFFILKGKKNKLLNDWLQHKLLTAFRSRVPSPARPAVLWRWMSEIVRTCWEARGRASSAPPRFPEFAWFGSACFSPPPAPGTELCWLAPIELWAWHLPLERKRMEDERQGWGKCSILPTMEEDLDK